MYEKYYQGGPDEARWQYSVTKSVLSVLVGIAIGQGLIESANSEVYRYVPEAMRDAMTGRATTLTVHHVLTLTSGLDDNGGDAGDIDPHMLAMWFSKGLIHPPGEVFARQYLFDPIGVRDMARLGCLYLRRGRCNGRQVVPESWVDVSTAKQASIGKMYQTPGIDDAYGYGWWTMRYGEHPAFSAIGAKGQRICAIPDLDLVIVFSGSGGGDVEHLPIIRDCILAAIRE